MRYSRVTGSVILLLLGGITAGLLAQQPQKPGTDSHGDPLPPGAVARLGTVRQRTTATAFAVSPDGKTLITIAGGRTIGRWAADTGRLLDEIHLPGPLAHDTWFSADGKTVAVAERDSLSVWDTSTGKRLSLLSVQASHVAFTPDGKALATATSAIRGGKDQVRIWDLKTGKDRQLAEIPSYANDLAFDARGERLFAAVDNHSLRCWDASTGKQLWQNDAWASRIAVSPDGRLLCSNKYLGGPTFLWDGSTGEKVASLGEDRVESSQVAFSPDGRSLAQGTWKDVLIWDVESRKLRHRLAGAGPRFVFAPDGKSLFTLGQMLLRWDVATGKPLFADVRGDGHVGPVLSVAFASDGKSLASGGADRTVRIWEVGGGKHRILSENGPANGGRQVGGDGGFHAFSVGTVEFTPDNKYLVTDAAAGTLALTDVATGKEVRTFQLPKPKNGWVTVAAARLTADGKTLLASGHTTAMESFSYLARDQKETVRAWDVATGREALSCEVPSSGADYGSVFSPDGRLFAPGYDKHVYDLRQTGGPVPTVLKPEGLWPPAAFSPDGRLFAAAEVDDSGPPGKAIRILEVFTGRQVARVEAALGYGRAMAFSPDSRLLAVSGSDALYAWECSTGRRLLHLPARGRLTNWTPAGFCVCLAFAPDGGALATGHGDGTILLWDLATARKELGKSQNDSDAAACWADLAGEDAGKAYAAVDRLASIPEQALLLLRRELNPEKVDPKWLAARLAELDSDKFETREAASRELKKVVESVETQLRRELKRTASAEVRRQIAGVLESLAAIPGEAPSPDRLCRLRALAALERIASKEAVALLRDLAGGDADARLTREAAAALRRLDKGE